MCMVFVCRAAVCRAHGGRIYAAKLAICCQYEAALRGWLYALFRSRLVVVRTRDECPKQTLAPPGSRTWRQPIRSSRNAHVSYSSRSVVPCWVLLTRTPALVVIRCPSSATVTLAAMFMRISRLWVPTCPAGRYLSLALRNLFVIDLAVSYQTTVLSVKKISSDQL